MAGREVLDKGVRWNISDGHSTRIWRDPWIPNFPTLTPPPQSLFLQDLITVRDLISTEGECWNSILVNQLFPIRDIARSILSIPLCSSHQEDNLRWIHTKDGNYSVKSGYWVAKNVKDVKTSKPSSSSNNNDLWRWFWPLNIPPKIRLFFWRCMQGITQTKVKLMTRGLAIDPLCSRCGLDMETPEHVFRDCHWSAFLWNVSPLRVQPSTSCKRINIQDWILSCVSKKSQDYQELFAAYLWTIWKARNALEFRQKDMPHLECLNIATNIIFDYQSSNMKQPPVLSRQPNCLCWTPPSLGWVKCNSDASLHPNGTTGLGSAIRDNNGAAINFTTGFVSMCNDIELADALACRKGALLARESSYRVVMFELDNKTIVEFLVRGVIHRIEVGNIIADILHISKAFDRVSFQWVRRSCNRLTHELTNLARNPSFALDEWTPIPVTLRRIVAAEAAFELL